MTIMQTTNVMIVKSENNNDKITKTKTKTEMKTKMMI